MDITHTTPVAATFSKDSMFFGRDFPVKYITDTRGAFIRGNDGQWYLDWISGLGANLLGYDDRYANDGFYAYVAHAVRKGLAFSMPHELEYYAAYKTIRLLQQHVPAWSNTDLQVRWVLSGSDACNTALRLAKAVKSHGKVYSYGYHGWADQFVAATPPAHGLYDIPGVINLDWNGLPPNDADCAAIIIEVPPLTERPAYFDVLRNWCDTHNSLLIIDEVVTGLRYGRGGACEMYAIKPDIVCMGKALGNGMPIGAVIASQDLMDRFNPLARTEHDPVFVSSTNAGCTAGLAAANFMLDFVEDGKYLTYLQTLGADLQNELTNAGFNVIGNYARNLILWESDAHKAFSIAYFAKEGILINRPNFVNMAHTPADVERTINAAYNTMRDWRKISATERQQWQDRAALTLFRNR